MAPAMIPSILMTAGTVAPTEVKSLGNVLVLFNALAGPSGFHWLKFSRLELHVYNIRHLQHHVGQLNAALRRHQAEGIKWALSEAL